MTMFNVDLSITKSQGPTTSNEYISDTLMDFLGILLKHSVPKHGHQSRGRASFSPAVICVMP